MSINPLAALSGGASQVTGAVGKQNLGGVSAQKDQFLKLLLAQLQNQDPLNAPDASKFSEQMTAFGQLEQLFNLNDSMSKMASAGLNSQNGQSVALIGKNVVVQSDQLEVANGRSGTIGYQLEIPAQTVALEIRDAHGHVVRSMNMNDQAAGTTFMEFDGRDDAGRALPDGLYKMNVTASSADGGVIPVTSMMRSVVDGVQFTPDGTVLIAGTRNFNMTQVQAVMQ